MKLILITLFLVLTCNLSAQNVENAKSSTLSKENVSVALLQCFIIIGNDTIGFKRINKLKSKWIKNLDVRSEIEVPGIYGNFKGYYYFTKKEEYQSKVLKKIRSGSLNLDLENKLFGFL